MFHLDTTLYPMGIGDHGSPNVDQSDLGVLNPDIEFPLSDLFLLPSFLENYLEGRCCVNSCG
jgi:hypothetical protein